MAICLNIYKLRAMYVWNAAKNNDYYTYYILVKRSSYVAVNST